MVLWPWNFQCGLACEPYNRAEHLQIAALNPVFSESHLQSYTLYLFARIRRLSLETIERVNVGSLLGHL